MSAERAPVNVRGITAALAAPIFLGMAPIFGKMAYQVHADAFTVAAVRTVLAALILWVAYGLFFRKYIYIYPAGLLGCIVIGAINGIGSLFYYGGLTVLDASLVQLINGSYLAFAILLSRIGGQRASARTLGRVLLAMAALVVVTLGAGTGEINLVGVGLMLGSALMFAGTVILSQYVLFEMPAPTATLYILTTMGVVVSMVWLAVGHIPEASVLENALPPIVALAITTSLARLAMFAGVKFLGGMQTAVLGITEIAVSLLLAWAFLGDALMPAQWAGVALLFISILLIRQDDLLPHGINPSALIVANMASVQFQRIAFHRAFGTTDLDNPEGTMGAITTQELIAIQHMMGASLGGIDPFPIGQARAFMNTQLQDEYITSTEITIPPEIRRRQIEQMMEEDDSRI
jgi:drug/metabolite transporter (DMT)-like permease